MLALQTYQDVFLLSYIEKSFYTDDFCHVGFERRSNVSRLFYVNTVVDRIAAIVPEYIQLLSYDSTWLSQIALAPGFLELNFSDAML